MGFKCNKLNALLRAIGYDGAYSVIDIIAYKFSLLRFINDLSNKGFCSCYVFVIFFTLVLSKRLQTSS